MTAPPTPPEAPARSLAAAPLPPAVRSTSWAAGLFALALLALLVRLPYLQQVPRFTDEWDDTETALAIAHEPGYWPLISNDHYNGPVFHYLLAAGFRLGAGLWWPRALALFLGVGAVLATAALARSLALLLARPQEGGRLAGGSGGRDDGSAAGAEDRARRAGLIAGLLMATSFVPVAVNSHLAWSNSSTPFWTTVFLWLLVDALRLDAPRRLVLAGLAGGLAQQTHPSVLAILLGALLWAALCRPRWLRGPWPYAAALAGLLAFGNVIAFNLLSQEGGSLAMARERDYAFSGRLPEGADYLRNLGGAVRLSWQMLGSSFQAVIDETTDGAALRRMLLHPGALAAVIAGLLAMAALARRRAGSLPALLWLVALLFLPLFNQAWHHYILARYLAPLLPPCFAAIGLVLAPGLAGSDLRTRRRSFLLTLWLLVLVLHPLWRLNAYYRAETAAHKDNRRLWQLGEALPARATEARPVWLDYELRFQRSTAGGNVYRTLKGFLDAADADYEKLRAEDPPPAGLPSGTWLVLGDDRARGLQEAGLALRPAPLPEPLAPAAPGAYGLWETP